MKLLFVSANFPFPPRTGNTILSYNHIKHLAQRHHIDLVSLREPHQTDLGELANWCQNIHCVPKPAGQQLRAQKLIGKLRCLPSQKNVYASKEMTERVRHQLANNSYDAVIFLQTETIQFKPTAYIGVCILNMEDPLVLKFQRSLSRYDRAMQLRIRYEMALLKRYESKHIHEFDRILLLNAEDALAYQQIFPQGWFDWVPYGIDVNAFQPKPDIQREEGMIVITGSMYHPPNIEAVSFFCREVFPHVRQRAPSAQLWIVGANPTAEVRQWATVDGITVTGSVPDVRHYLHRALVSVCPVQLKVGTQTKVLEAMACGTPVVTTSAGNNGIAAQSGKDNSIEMAQRILSLLQKNNWEAMSTSGRNFVVQNFAWEQSTSRLEKCIEEAMHERTKS
jgi:polysaccharide biosynthesis protein PslH